MGRRLLWLAVLLLLVGLCWFGFREAGRDYLAFWLGSGPLIGLATIAIGFAWGGVDRNAGLVSADPAVYAGAAMQLAGLPLFVFGGHLRAKGAAVSAWDRLVILPLGLIYLGAMLGWLLLVAPAQYFAFLVFGAPSRIALASGWKGAARLERGRLDMIEGAAPPPGYWDATMREKPVSLASAFLAAGLGLAALLG